MVNKLSILLLSLLLGIQVNSQIPILRDSVLIEGFYKDFEEFTNNKPSIDIDYEITSKEFNCASPSITESESFEVFTVIVSSKSASEVGKVWGFCDGQKLYININNKNLRKKTKFSELTISNSMAYFNNKCTVKGNIINLKTGFRYVIDSEVYWHVISK